MNANVERDKREKGRMNRMEQESKGVREGWTDMKK